MTKQTSDYHGSKMMKTNQTTSFVVAAVLIQALSLPVMAFTEELHGVANNTVNPGKESVYLGFGLSLSTGGSNNVGIGVKPYGAPDIDHYGGHNIAIGLSPLYSNHHGTGNIAMGTAALFSNVDGGGNVALGSDSLESNVSGDRNIAIGQRALSKTTLGNDNIAIGFDALGNNKKSLEGGKAFSGVKARFKENVAIGKVSMWRHAGTGNVAIGSYSLVGGLISGKNQGKDNVAIGTFAGHNSGGSANVFIGAEAGLPVRSGNGNVLIGNRAGFMLPSDASNRLVIANGKHVKDQLIIGNFLSKRISLLGKVKVTGPVIAQSFNTTSDARLKQDIQPINDALSSVLQLQGKTYRWKEDHHKQDIGLIAQEVEQVFPELVDQDANGFKAIAYSRLTTVLIEAIKEQQGQMVSQQDQMIAQQQQIATLEKENTQLKTIMAEQMQALLARVAMLEGESLAAN